MPKRCLRILIIISCLITLSGCGEQPPAGTDALPTDIITPDNETDTPVITPTDPPTDEPTVEPTQNDEPDEIYTYLLRGVEYVPVSCLRDGTQTIIDFENSFDWGNFPLAVDGMSEYAVQGMYKEGSRQMQSYTFDKIATNGDWDLFPTKVTYERYALDTQPDNPEWMAYFQHWLEANKIDSPLVFTTAWLFDWNGDGVEDAVVIASNIEYYPDDDKMHEPNPPYRDNAGMYYSIALFLSGTEPQPLGFQRTYDVDRHPLEWDMKIYRSFLPQEEEDDYTKFSSFFTVQYDQQVNLIQCPVYILSPHEHPARFEMILTDIDGCGQSEIVAEIYDYHGTFHVYKRIDNTISEVFTIEPPA